MVHTPPAARGYSGPEIPNNLYVLEVRAVTLLPANGEPDQWGNIKDKLRIHWLVTDLFDGDGNEVFVDDRVNNSISDGAGGRFPPSNYYKICAALGVETENGVDSDTLIGKQCQGMVETEDVEGAWPRITRYVKLTKGKASAPSQRPVAASQHEPSTDAYEKHLDEMDAYWKKVVSAGIVRSELIEQSRFTYEKEPFDLSPEERQALYDMMLGTLTPAT